MVASSRSQSLRMPASPRGSIHDEQDNPQQDLQTIKNNPFRYISPSQRDLIPQKDYYDQISGSLRKESDFVKPGAIPGGMNRYMGQHDHEKCARCTQFRRLNYGLSCLLGIIILLLGYISFSPTRIPPQFSTEVSLPPEKHVGFVQNQPSVLQERATSDQVNIIIPAYFGPEDTASWGKVLAQISKFHNVLGFTIIINPSNGPGGTEEVTRYSSLIESLAKYSNVKIIGYIHQSWGNRDITNDVDTWISYFPGKLDGFFLDEMPSVKSDTNLSAVQSNNAYIKKKSSFYFRGNRSPLIVQNPGTEVDSSFYSLRYDQDVTIILENKDAYLTQWISLNRGSANQSPSTLGMILLTVSATEMESAVKTMLGYSRYIFATGYSEAQAYTSIASNFGTLVSAAYKYGGMGSAKKTTATAVRATTTKKLTAPKSKSKAKTTKTTKRKFPTAAARREQASSQS
ncbi:hypothetical protein TWF106_003527 [Orbilia oligospora]|uniref:Spherulin 4-like cell surface protein n=1 Tax=Orbilia oligospora TaxID=2813651 RepID=A0A7C8UE42_ORBOL|nr:hypothetical protein TWF106_003527 [Orbilia oligospora]KAF3217748.1 hypothetical protein TWF679_001948 [Orbilia oligospora]